MRSYAGPHLLRMRADAAARIQIHRFEWSDHGPSQAEAIAHDCVYVLDGRNAVAHEAICFAQHGALQPVENETLDFFRYQHGLQAGIAEKLQRALRDVMRGKRRGHNLDHGNQVRRIARMRNQATMPSGQVVNKA